MAFEFIQIPVSGQGPSKEDLNKLLRARRVVAVVDACLHAIPSANRVQARSYNYISATEFQPPYPQCGPASPRV